MTLQMTLPDHLWLEITAYLPPQDIWSLHGVNRVLSDVALNHRYRSWVVDLNYQRNPRAITRLRRLLHHTRRVRELVFRCEEGQHETTTTPPRSTVWGFINSLKQPCSNSPFDVVSVLENLPNVSTMRIDCGRGADEHQAFKNATDLFGQALKIFARTVHVLHVQTLVSSIPHIFARHLHIELLTDLKVIMLHRNAQEDAFEDNMLADFINRHHLPLHSLELNVQNIRYDLSPLISSLQPLPFLRHLTYYITPMTDRDAIIRFFRTQSTTLRSLTFYAHLTGEMADTLFGELSATPFPELERLHIDLGIQGVRLTTPKSVSFLCNIIQTLTVLDISQCGLTEDQCEHLISRMGSSALLTELGIRPLVVTPNLVSSFATQFHGLVSLDLHASKFRGTVPNGNDNAEMLEFCSEIKFRYLSRWKLRHLTLPSDAFHTYYQRSCVIALVAAIPSLITVNNSLRKPTARLYRGIEYRNRS